jgi:hypothetical protein
LEQLIHAAGAQGIGMGKPLSGTVESVISI